MAIPVYAFTGFLDAGKTKFIQETLEDERFNAGERTLLLICEEGEEEYDLSVYPYQHVYPEVIDQEAVTTEELSQLFKKHHCERVVVELNGMLQVGPFYQKMPEDWQIAQEVMFADGTSILATTPTCAPLWWTSSRAVRWSCSIVLHRARTSCRCTSSPAR